MNKMNFTLEHMENMFEIGRILEAMNRNKEIDLDEFDSKTAFAVALDIAQRFEMEHPETEEYYTDIEMFAVEKIMEKLGKEG